MRTTKATVSVNTLFFAMKYALGRRSSAPSIVATDIIANLDSIDSLDIERFVVEIEKYANSKNTTSEEIWLNLKKDLQLEIKLRKSYGKE